MAIAGEPAPVHGEQAELYAFICDVLPRQGCWNEDAYLWLTDQTRRLVELADGRIEVLPMPTDGHQGILHYLNEVSLGVRAFPWRQGSIRALATTGARRQI